MFCLHFACGYFTILMSHSTQVHSSSPYFCFYQEVFHSSEPDGGDDNSSFNRMVHQIINRLDVLEDTLKESSRYSGDPFHSRGRKSTLSSPTQIQAAPRTDQLLADIMVRNQQIEQIKAELHQIHEAVLSYLQVPRPTAGTQASPLSNYRPINNPQWGQKQLSNSVVSQTIREEDFMRNFIDKKVNRRDNDLPVVMASKKKKKRRRPKNERGYRSEELSLSGSWEDVSHTEVESIF